jgi:hypothetical protein
VALVVGILGRTSNEGEMFLLLAAVVAVLAALWIPRAAARDGEIGPWFLAAALAAHILGALLRYMIIQTVYHGVGDANGYFGAGSALVPEFRALEFPGPHAPYVGTEFVNWVTGILFAITGPTMMGGFLVFSVFSFFGSWFLYKAFRVSFPDGNHRLFAVLIFLLPSMWYWPSSLGKDALVVFFLGVATYGFALLLRSLFARGLFVATLGLAGMVMVRAPTAAALAVAGAGAFLIRPARERSPQLQAIVWLVMVPLLAVMAYLAVGYSQQYLKDESPIEAFEAQQAKEFTPSGVGSNFEGVNPFTPAGLPVALVTVNFRPFPWEAGSLPPALAAVEGLFLLGLVVVRVRAIGRGLAQWRSNGMIIVVVGAWLALSIVLSALTNFGLLARQRTQALPYLLMMISVAPLVRRRPTVEEAEEAGPALEVAVSRSALRG